MNIFLRQDIYQNVHQNSPKCDQIAPFLNIFSVKHVLIPPSKLKVQIIVFV